MSTEDFRRKLTAILSADVEGYSRLMGQDEAGTISTLTEYKAAITAQMKNEFYIYLQKFCVRNTK